MRQEIYPDSLHLGTVRSRAVVWKYAVDSFFYTDDKVLEVLTVPFVAKVKEERLNGHFLNPVIDVCRDLQSSTVAPPFFRSSHPGRERHTSSMQIIFRVLNKYFL